MSNVIKFSDFKKDNDGITWVSLSGFQKKVAIALMLLAIGIMNYYVFTLPFWPLVKVGISAGITGYIGFLVVRASKILNQL
ncbi:hypothetical protein AB9R81_23425 [Vibrio cyclitrophicus]